jgi:ribonuclease HI
MIFSCHRAKVVWNLIGVWQKIRNLLETDRSGSIVLEEVIQRGEQVQGLEVGFAELILSGGWFLWERRQLVHGENIQRPSRSGLFIVSLTKNFKLAAGKGSKIRQGWRKPPKDYIMLNIDVSYDDDNGCGSTSAIIRDSSGGMIAVTNTYIPHLVDAPMAEAYALKEGLMLAQHIGGNRLIVQSDCMEVVEIMRNGGFTANLAAAIYDECNIVWGRFQEISIEHSSREANQVARELARQAMFTKENCIWDDDPPSFIIPFLSRCNYSQSIKLAYGFIKKKLKSILILVLRTHTGPSSIGGLEQPPPSPLPSGPALRGPMMWSSLALISYCRDPAYPLQLC